MKALIFDHLVIVAPSLAEGVGMSGNASTSTCPRVDATARWEPATICFA